MSKAGNIRDVLLDSNKIPKKNFDFLVVLAYPLQTVFRVSGMGAGATPATWLGLIVLLAIIRFCGLTLMEKIMKKPKKTLPVLLQEGQKEPALSNALPTD